MSAMTTTEASLVPSAEEGVPPSATGATKIQAGLLTASGDVCPSGKYDVEELHVPEDEDSVDEDDWEEWEEWERIQCSYWEKQCQEMLNENSNDMTDNDRDNLESVQKSGSGVWPPRG